MIINYKTIDDNVIEPEKGSDYAAGVDLCAHLPEGSKSVYSGETVKIGTGICAEIPYGYFGAIFARSGLATKNGIRPANCVGVVDADYRGEIIVAVHNDSSTQFTINDGDRIAQLVIIPYLPVRFEKAEELSDTSRGCGGFGSTGIK